jgi:uncharacterized membrane protein YdjX (TVP38/TMEM64 family)
VTKRVKYGFGILLAGGLLTALLLVPWSRWALLLVEWTRDVGLVGVVVYFVAYVAATLLLLPGSILTAGAGLAYGPLWGTVLVSPVSVVAATLAFLLGRGIAREWVTRRIAQHPRFGAIDEAIGDSGFKIVLLLRLSPIFPFNLLNYALGLTRVSLRDYVLASLLGMLPGTFLYVYLGSLVTTASELLSGKRPAIGLWGKILYWAGLAATLVVTILITRMARQALNKALDPTQRRVGLPSDSEARP